MLAGDLVSGKYRLLRQLGAGGMGSVWAARNELTDRDFAIKFLLPDLANNQEALHRFFLEARACGQIKHPAVVDVYDMGQAEDGSPYIVMELLEGEGFDARLARAGTFRPGDAAVWLAFVSRGLEEAHVRGLVHRDLKPGNIFFALDARGDIVPKLLDFGVSKATGLKDGDDFVKTTTGAVLGSPAYMSPEQAKGEQDIDGRSDVWSLGVILYEALTGQIPFDAPNYNALMLAIITRPHRPLLELAPHVPPELSAIVDHALAKERAHRIGTARELAERLEMVAQRITQTPLLGKPMSLPPGAADASGSLPAIPPAPRQFATTEGTWSDARKTPARKRRRSSTVLVTATLLVATLATAGVIAFLQVNGPMVAVAGRAAVALNTSLARLRQQLDAIRAADAEAKAKAEAEAAAKAEPKPAAPVEPSDPSAEPAASSEPGSGHRHGAVRRPYPAHRAAPAAAGTATSAGSKASGDDPHGGVDSAGF
ncbi:MAG TPA: serine/threonine-protein kinase [Minicystis sp.]|nr:serine/threonine-protein kinase [Minicystis sp.]